MTKAIPNIGNPKLFSAYGRDYSYHDIKSALQCVGVGTGASVFVHSDIGRFGTLADVRDRETYITFFLKALSEVVGEEGTLIMPTFTYSFCKHEVYDPLATPSTVGILTEYFRTRPGVERSREGIFSVAAHGPLARHFTVTGSECFGSGSIFEKLYLDDVIILFMGETFDITFMHFVERQVHVPYRYDKVFPGIIRCSGELLPYEFTYFVRGLEKPVTYDLEKIADKLSDKGILSRVGIGASKVRAVSARAAFDAIASGLNRDNEFLIG